MLGPGVSGRSIHFVSRRNRGRGHQRLWAAIVAVAVAGVLPSASAAAAAHAPGLSPAGPESNAAPANSFVTRNGQGLVVDGQPFRFSGLNIYQANSAGSCGGDFVDGTGLDQALTSIGSGIGVIRAWFFQDLATNAGQRDWSAFDHTIAVAKAHGVRVIATLANQWADCEPAAGYKDPAWYQTGYKNPDPGGTVSYRDWAAEIAAHYANEPTILAWQLMNEAEVGDCGTVPESTATSLLKSFATDVSGAVKAADPNHLVSLGTIGSGQCGAEADDYQDVMSVPSIDLCEYHDDVNPGDPLPGDQYNGLLVRLQECAGLDKPLFLGEVGIPRNIDGTSTSPFNLPTRASDMDAKLSAEYVHGVVGAVAWNWSNTPSGAGSYEIGPGDPVLDSLRHWGGGDCPGAAADVLTAPPASVRQDQLTSDCSIRMFEEGVFKSPAAGIPVDVDQPGTYDGKHALTPSVIPPGTPTETFFLHADRHAAPSDQLPFDATFSFPYPVLGVQLRSESLDAAEASGIAHVGTLYPVGSSLRGLELTADGASDAVVLSQDGMRLTVHFVVQNIFDQVRVITGPPAVADLVLTDDIPTIVPLGDQVTYNLKVTNLSGPDSAADVVLTDLLPPTETFVTAAPSKGTCSVSDGTLSCEFHTLAQGDEADVQITFDIGQAGSMTNAVTVSSSAADPDLSNNAITTTTTTCNVSDTPGPTGTVSTWGRDDRGQLGNGTVDITPAATPAPINVAGVSSIAAGGLHDLAVRPVGLGEVWGWGDNTYGELGTRPGIDPQPEPQIVPHMTQVTSVDASWGYSVALRCDGTVWTWGYPGFGELGHPGDGLTPAPVRGTGGSILRGVTQIAQGYGHDVVLAGGQVLTWGKNLYGEIGDGSLEDASQAVPVPLPQGVTIVSVGAADFDSFAITEDGSVYAWGINEQGALGDPDFSAPYSSSPRLVPGIEDAASVDGGGYDNFMLTRSGEVWGWGPSSALGLPFGTVVAPTRLTGLPLASDLKAGSGGAVIAQADRSIWTWGSGPDQGRTDSATYGPILDLGAAIAVDDNQDAALAIIASGLAPQTITFTSSPPTAAYVGGPSYALSATGGASGSPVVFSVDAASSGVCTISGSTVSFAAAGTCTIDADQAGDAHYAAAPQVQQTFSVASHTTPAVTLARLPDVSPSNAASFLISATWSEPVTDFTTSDVSASGAVVSGFTGSGAAYTWVVTPTADGSISTTVAAGAATDLNGYVSGAAISLPVWISDQSPPAITNVSLNHASVTPGAAVSIHATASDPRRVGSAQYSIDGGQWFVASPDDGSFGDATEAISASLAAPGAAGSHHICLRANDALGNESDGSACATLTVVKASQTITFANPGTRTMIQSPLTLTATASSGLPVTLSSTTHSVCTVTGFAITLVIPGSCSITATQAGSAGYNAAPPITRTFTVNKANQTITFASPGTRTMLQSPLTVSATASSGLPVTLSSTTTSVCTVTGFAIAFVIPGSCSITATQAGNASYNAAPAITRTFTVNKVGQTITFAAIPNQTLPASTVALAPTASSGLTVALSTTSAAVICTLSGTTITIVGAGTCTITASQGGDNTYNAAPSINRSFTISKVAQTITFANPGTRTLLPPTSDPASHPTVVTSPTASSGLAVTLTSNNSVVCTVSDYTVTLLSAGTCSLTASQVGDVTYKVAPNITRTFAVNQVTQTITFVNPGSQSIHLPTVNASPWATSDLPATLSSNSPGVCTASGTTITLLALGTCSISATQPGNANYRAATTVTRTFTVVDQVTQTIVLPNPGPQSMLVPTVLASPWASSGLPVTLTSTTLPVCTVSGSLITLHAAGSCALTATQPGDVAHRAAATAHQTFTVTASTPLGFVVANGTQLKMDGQTFVFDGAAVYHASSGNPAQTPAQAIALASQAKLNIVRLTDIFDESANGNPYSETNWAIQDEIIARARGAGMRVVLDLSSFRNYLVNRDIRLSGVNCGGGAVRTPADYLAVDPYRPALESEWETFLSWVVNRVNTMTGVRYGDDATIAVISVAGEPHGSGTEDCGKAVSTSDLTDFYARTLGYLASIDPNHLRSNGGLTQTDWQQVYGGAANSGIDGQSIFALTANTLPSLHTYPPAYASDGTPIDYQSPNLGLFAHSLNKPWFTEEFGWTQSYGDAKRASYYQWLYAEQATYGSSGALLWNLGDEIGFHTYDVNPNTPSTWAVVLTH